MTRSPSTRARSVDLTERLTGTVADVLGLHPGTVRDTPTLFELPGFDSIAVVAILDRLEADLAVEVDPDLIVPDSFESVGTLVDLAQRCLDRYSAGGSG
jgi:acyl carrier protein